MSEPKAYHCPNCGAQLDVDIRQSRVKCPYCESVINMEELNNQNDGLNFTVRELIRRADILLKDHEFEKAAAVYEQALIIDAHNSAAYFGLLMSELNCANENALIRVKPVFYNDNNYQHAYEYADKKERKYLEHLRKCSINYYRDRVTKLYFAKRDCEHACNEYLRIEKKLEPYNKKKSYAWVVFAVCFILFLMTENFVLYLIPFAYMLIFDIVIFCLKSPINRQLENILKQMGPATPLGYSTSPCPAERLRDAHLQEIATELIKYGISERDLNEPD